MPAASSYSYCWSKYSFALSGSANGGWKSLETSNFQVRARDLEENVVSVADTGMQPEQQIEKSEQQKSDKKLIVLELQ